MLGHSVSSLPEIWSHQREVPNKNTSPACGFSAGPHASLDCLDKSVLKCVNCSSLDSPAKRCHHPASSLDCPVMISERNIVMENTDFGSSKKRIALSRRPLRCGIFNIRSIRNKVCFVIESLAEHTLDLLSTTETWLLPSDITIIGVALPSFYSFHHVPRSTDARGGGGGVTVWVFIQSRALLNVRLVPNHMDVSSFEFLEITFSLHLQDIRMAILYRPGHPGSDRAFMEDFGQFLEILSVCWEKLVICGAFNYWLDNPSLKPCTNEFMSLLNINNMSNYVQVPTHISGHILNLVLTPVGVDLVNQVEVSPIDHKISDHALITFELGVIGPTTYSKKITVRSYRGLKVREVTSIIENDLLSAVAEGQTSLRHVDSYNRGFTSLRDQFCPLVTKEIRVRDDAEWYDHRVVSLRWGLRRAGRRWRRIGSDAARTLFVSSRRAVVKQIYICRIEYYQHQMSQCDGDQ